MAYLVTAASVAIHGVDVSWCVGVVLRIIVCADPSVVGCGIRVGVFVTVVVCSASLLRLLCLFFSNSLALLVTPVRTVRVGYRFKHAILATYDQSLDVLRDVVMFIGQ